MRKGQLQVSLIVDNMDEDKLYYLEDIKNSITLDIGVHSLLGRQTIEKECALRSQTMNS